MDEQREFALPGFVSALGATRKPHIFIRIEKEAVTGWLLPKPYLLCLLFPTCHCSVAIP
jgi:hypothetical protein